MTTQEQWTAQQLYLMLLKIVFVTQHLQQKMYQEQGNDSNYIGVLRSQSSSVCVTRTMTAKIISFHRL